MASPTKPTLFNDPIYGFIGIPNALLFGLVEHPFFQRLRRISQMGLSHLVYPGAQHTRFHHALGSMYLMQKALATLRTKKVAISEAEEVAALAAILMHDIGHGPFSHAMEHSLVENVPHEHISLLFMEALNHTFDGDLNMALAIFKGQYPKRFLNQLVSSQLDMDRLDYLKRDSFYTGVSEGNINADRLISMLNVRDGELVVEEKGIYSVEKFLMARRFMYWQVYLHKTGLVAEALLINTLRRAKELMAHGTPLPCSEPLRFFLTNRISKENFDRDTLHVFSLLDDVDVLSAIKQWRNHADKVLSELCGRILDRKLLDIKVKKHPIPEERLQQRLKEVGASKHLSPEEASY
ncbi:MAG: HD domain-containing protein, partial [Flavobacteriaceae bacterium]